MRSIVDASAIEDDRSTKARIRDAAIECIAAEGLVATTARKVAEAAGVSPGLVMHHFGSMDGLRRACDEHVAGVIRQGKRQAFAAGADLDVLGALRQADLHHVIGYLAAVLSDDSPAVVDLVDELVADAEGYLAEGIAAGLLRPTADLRARAVVLMLWNLGGLVLHRHLHRLLGVDLTDPSLDPADPGFSGYAAAVYEIYGEGIVTGALAGRLRDAFAGTTAPPSPARPQGHP